VTPRRLLGGNASLSAFSTQPFVTKADSLSAHWSAYVPAFFKAYETVWKVVARSSKRDRRSNLHNLFNHVLLFDEDYGAEAAGEIDAPFGWISQRTFQSRQA
jgi:hypothetical protein